MVFVSISNNKNRLNVKSMLQNPKVMWFIVGLTNTFFQGDRPSTRAAHAMTAVGNKAYVFGGRHQVISW